MAVPPDAEMSHVRMSRLEPSVPAARKALRGWMKADTAGVRRGMALGTLEGLTLVVFAWGLSHVVSDLWTGPRERTTILWPALAIALSLLARGALGFFAQASSQMAARRIIRAIRLDIMDKALKGRIDPRRHAHGFNALFEDTEALEGYYARFHQADIQARLLPVLTLGIIATQSWVAALILLLTLAPFIAMMAVLGMSSAAESRRQMDALSRLSNLLLDRIKALPLILAFNDGERQTKTIGHAASDVAERTLRVLKIAFVTSAVLEFFSALSVALIAVYCGFYLLGELPFRSPEPLSLGTAFFVLALSPEVYAPMRRLAAAYHDRQTALAAAQRLTGLTPSAPAVPAPALTGPPKIAYRDVSVTFPDDPDFHIGPVSFTCTPGSVTCLAGASGSGKTSLMRLLIEASCPGVTVDGRPVGADYDLSAQIAYASQVPPILAGSLRDNLRLANTTASEDDILRAVEQMGLLPLITSRPEGLDTVLDERGSGLSGGERRRIGLARAALKSAPVLLLDEPTADLDPASEDDIIARLPALFKDRTVLFTSHSPRLKALAQQVIAL